jgi:hypothetical protein
MKTPLTTHMTNLNANKDTYDREPKAARTIYRPTPATTRSSCNRIALDIFFSRSSASLLNPPHSSTYIPSCIMIIDMSQTFLKSDTALADQACMVASC